MPPSHPQSEAASARVAQPQEPGIGLYVVVLRLPAGHRRQRVRRLLAAHGQQINPDSYELPTNPRGLRALMLALAPELVPGDDVRIYPVCRRCQSSVKLFGAGELAQLPVAFVY